MEKTVIVSREKNTGIIVLNRPKVLNSLNLDMVQEITKALLSFKEDPSISQVLMEGAGDRAFCAGADVRHILQLVQQGLKEDAFSFFEEEYRLNKLIKEYPKPFISLLDGITMGGGVGLAHHGTYRVASEKYVFAMPEVTIGLFPDVGASHILARLPNSIGYYLGMTGMSINQQDAFSLGLVTHKVPSHSFPLLKEALLDNQPIDLVLNEFCEKGTGISELEDHTTLIKKTFSVTNSWDVYAALKKEADQGQVFAQKTLALMETKSPLSMAVAFELIRRAAQLTLEDVLALDLLLARKIVLSHDFCEGVRAQLIDKDKNPQWQPKKFDISLQPVIDSLFI